MSQRGDFSSVGDTVGGMKKRNSGVRNGLRAESSMEKGVRQEPGKALVAQGHLVTHLPKTEEAFLCGLIFLVGKCEEVEGRYYFPKSSQFIFQFLCSLLKIAHVTPSLSCVLNLDNLGISEHEGIISGKIILP